MKSERNKVHDGCRLHFVGDSTTCHLRPLVTPDRKGDLGRRGDILGRRLELPNINGIGRRQSSMYVAANREETRDETGGARFMRMIGRVAVAPWRGGVAWHRGAETPVYGKGPSRATAEMTTGGSSFG